MVDYPLWNSLCAYLDTVKILYLEDDLMMSFRIQLKLNYISIQDEILNKPRAPELSVSMSRNRSGKEIQITGQTLLAWRNISLGV